MKQAAAEAAGGKKGADGALFCCASGPWAVCWQGEGIVRQPLFPSRWMRYRISRAVGRTAGAGSAPVVSALQSLAFAELP